MPTPLEQLKEEIVNGFDKRSWGSCFECCDFEQLLDEIGNALNEYAQAYHSQKLQEYKDKLNKEGLGKEAEWPEGMVDEIIKRLG